jgi:predicted dienelactone hydrolase
MGYLILQTVNKNTMKTIRFVKAWNVLMLFAISAIAATAYADNINDPSCESSGNSHTSFQPVNNTSAQREYSAASVEMQWFDAGRSRLVPVKIYYPDSAAGPFPLILFSHGLGRTCEDCSYLGAHWAARGYVSAFVEHAGSDASVWKGKAQPKKHLKEAYENPATMQNRPLDMLFVLDRLEQLKQEGDPLARRMDFDRIAAAGCDLGAETVLTLAGQVLPNGMTFADRRIRAVIAMSPPVVQGRLPLNAAYDDIRVPCLYITGTQDDGIVGETKAYERRIPFDYTAGADRYLVTFFGGDHMIYSGHLRQRNSDKDSRFQPLIRDASTLFWDAYLQDRPESLAAVQHSGLSSLIGSAASVESHLATEQNIANTVSRRP